MAGYMEVLGLPLGTAQEHRRVLGALAKMTKEFRVFGDSHCFQEDNGRS